MTKPMISLKQQPSLTEDVGVVTPGLTAVKPKKADKKYRQQTDSLGKWNMDEQAVGEVDTTMSADVEQKEGMSKMDVIAFLEGYMFKDAGSKATGKVIPGSGGVQVGSKKARKDPEKYRKMLRGKWNKGKVGDARANLNRKKEMLAD